MWSRTGWCRHRESGSPAHCSSVDKNQKMSIFNRPFSNKSVLIKRLRVFQELSSRQATTRHNRCRIPDTKINKPPSYQQAQPVQGLKCQSGVRRTRCATKWSETPTGSCSACMTIGTQDIHGIGVNDLLKKCLVPFRSKARWLRHMFEVFHSVLVFQCFSMFVFGIVLP